MGLQPNCNRFGCRHDHLPPRTDTDCSNRLELPPTAIVTANGPTLQIGELQRAAIPPATTACHSGVVSLHCALRLRQHGYVQDASCDYLLSSIEMKKTRGRGQPPAGLHGEKSSEYHRLTIRVPDVTVARLERLAEQLEQPYWRIVHDALKAYRPRRKSGSDS